MPTYAKDTSVSTDQSRAEIERTLKRYGAQSFLYGWDQDKAVLGFEIKQRRYRIFVPLPDKKEFRYTEVRRTLRSQQAIEEAWEQACRQRWRAMALYIKATLEAAEAGITSLEVAMQPHLVLPNGRTVGEWLGPQIEQIYQTGLPPMLPEGKNG